MVFAKITLKACHKILSLEVSVGMAMHKGRRLCINKVFSKLAPIVLYLDVDQVFTS